MIFRGTRCVCSIDLFAEVRPDVLVNTCITSYLAVNSPQRACLLLGGQDVHTAFEFLSLTFRDLTDLTWRVIEPGPFQDGLGTKAPHWTSMEEALATQHLLVGRDGPDSKESAYIGCHGNDMSQSLKLRRG